MTIHEVSSVFNPILSFDMQTLQRLLDAETLLYQERLTAEGKSKDRPADLEKVAELVFAPEHTEGQKAGLAVVESLTSEQLCDLHVLMMLGRGDMHPDDLEHQRALITESPHTALALYEKLHQRYVHQALQKRGYEFTDF